MLKNMIIILATGLIIQAAGCATRHTVQVEPVEVKPIHITIDVNIRVDRALDDFFGDIDQAAEKIDTEKPYENDSQSEK